MNLHSAEIAKVITPGAHAMLLLDQAGWHTTQKLVLPANITLLPLPARSSKLNPVENLWQNLTRELARQPDLCPYEAILDHRCDAWNRIIDQPWRIASIGLRAWAHEF